MTMQVFKGLTATHADVARVAPGGCIILGGADAVDAPFGLQRVAGFRQIV